MSGLVVRWYTPCGIGSGPMGMAASGPVVKVLVDFNTGTTPGAATLPSGFSASRASVRYVQTSASTMAASTVAAGSLAISQRGAAASRGLTIERATVNLVPRTLGGTTTVLTTSGQWDNPSQVGAGTATLNATTGPDGAAHAWSVTAPANATTGFGWYTFPWSSLNGSGWPLTLSLWAKQNAISAFVWSYGAPTSVANSWTLTNAWARYQQEFTTTAQYIDIRWVLPDGRTLSAASAYGDFPQIESNPYATTYADYGTPRAAESLSAAASIVVFGGRLHMRVAFAALWGTAQLGAANDTSADRMLWCRDATTQCRIVGASRQVYAIVEGTPCVFPALLVWNAGDQIVLDVAAGNGYPVGWYSVNGGPPISLGTPSNIVGGTYAFPVTTLVSQPYLRTEDATVWILCDGTSGTAVSQLDADVQTLAFYQDSGVSSPGATYYASATGSGTGLTRSSPASLSSAITLARAAGPGATVLIRGNTGTYYLGSTLALTASDNGVTYQGYPGDASPVLSGATVLSQTWTQVGSSSVWQTTLASAPGRQLFVNGVRANIAYKSATAPTSWTINGSGFIPAATDKSTIGAMSRPQDVIVYLDTTWRHMEMPSTAYNSGTGQLTTNTTALANMQSWTGNLVTNASITGYGGTYELMAAPGDYSYNSVTGILSYWVRAGDTMSTAIVETSSLQAVVTIGGALGAKATSVTLRGITMEGGDWMGAGSPATIGYSSVAGGVTGFIGNYYGAQGPYNQMPAAVQVTACAGLVLAGMTIRRMAAAGISYLSGAQRSVMEGSAIYDTQGPGIFDGDVTAAAFAQTDTRAWVSGNMFRRNMLTSIGITRTAFHDSPGIAAGCSAGTVWAQNTVGGSTATGTGYGSTYFDWGWGEIAAQNPLMMGARTVVGNSHSYSGVGFTIVDGGSTCYFNGFNSAGQSNVFGNWFGTGPASVIMYFDNGTNNVVATGNVCGMLSDVSTAFYIRFNQANIPSINNALVGNFAGASMQVIAGDPSNTVTGTTLATPLGATAVEITRAAGAFAAHQ